MEIYNEKKTYLVGATKSLDSTGTLTDATEGNHENGSNTPIDPEVEMWSEANDNWSYLFIHHTKVPLVNKVLQKHFVTFIHKTVVFRREDKRIRKDEKPTVSGLLFVQGKCDRVQAFLRDYFPGLLLVKDCSTNRVAVIPDSVMQSFMRVAQVAPTRIRLMPHPYGYYAEGNPLVRITSGILSGLEGYRIRISRDKCLITSIGGMTVAISGIHKESFENLDEYVRLRREQLRGKDTSTYVSLTPLQMEIDACFFTPQNELDVLAMADRLTPWIIRAKEDLRKKEFDEAVEISLFILEEAGSRFLHAYRLGSLLEMRRQCVQADGILTAALGNEDVSADLKEIIETQKQSLLVRFPFLPISE